MAKHDYQAIVLGAGPGGYPCAIRLAQLGVKTLVVEKEHYGGVCLNVGCIPSKALITAAKRLEEIQHADSMGIVVSGEVSMDMKKLQKWKQSVTSKLSGGIAQLLDGNKVDKVDGTGRLTGPNEVSVSTADGEKVFTADHIVIATGSRPIEIPGFSYADESVLDSTKALALDTLPDKLVVVGGGYIGLEMGGMFAKLGTSVTVVEGTDSLLPGFDKDAVKVVQRKLKKAKVDVLLKTKALGGRRRATASSCAWKVPRESRRSRPARCWSPWGASPTAKIWAWRTSGSTRTVDSSRPITSDARTCPASSRSATWRASRCWLTRPRMRVNWSQKSSLAITAPTMPGRCRRWCSRIRRSRPRA